MGEGGGRLAPEEAPSRIWSAVAASRSRPRMTRSTPWRRSSTTTDRTRTSSSRPGRGWAGRRRSPTSSAHGPTIASIQRSRPPPSITRSVGPVEPALAAAARAAGPCHRRPCSCGPRLERRPRAVAAIDQAVAAESIERGRVGAASSSRWRIGPSSALEPEPGQVLEQAGVVLGPATRPIVVLDPQQHGRTRRARRRPTRTRRSRRGRGGASRSGPARSASGDASQRGDRQPDRSCRRWGSRWR